MSLRSRGFASIEEAMALRRLLGALLAAIAAAALATASRAEAAPGMEIALQDDAVLLQHRYYDSGRALTQLADLGVTRIRTNLLWAYTMPAAEARRRTQPRRVDYDFSAFDRLIASAAAHGIRVQLTIAGPAPAWATGNHRVGPYKPRADKFGPFVRAVALHFHGRVDRYSIWNEPNYAGWLAPLAKAPSLYRSLYIAGYRGVKGADPSAKVLIGETVPYAIKHLALAPLAFLRATTCTDRHWHRHGCVGLRADGYAHHPYEFAHAPSARYPGSDNVTIGTLGRLTSGLAKLARSGALRTPAGAPLDLYQTEFGYFATGRRALPAARRAAYLRQAFAIARRNPHVREMLQYLLVQPPRKAGAFDTALLPRSGAITPAYRALRAVAGG
jgi:hypothetical protein